MESEFLTQQNFIIFVCRTLFYGILITLYIIAAMKILKSLSFLFLGIFAFGCTPNTTEGIVSVIDLNTGAAVADANVEIYVDQIGMGFYLCSATDPTERMVYKTNAGGVTEKICFKLPAVLKVVATSGSKTGTTTLSLVEGESTTVTCKISN